MVEQTVTFRGDVYVWTQCGTCAVWYTVPLLVYEKHRELGGFHFCPVLGHQWGWRTGTQQREQDRLKQDAARMADEIAAEKARADAAEKKYLQARRRATAGVCPCCNRTFENVQRHMLSKHKNVPPLAQRGADSK